MKMLVLLATIMFASNLTVSGQAADTGGDYVFTFTKSSDAFSLKEGSNRVVLDSLKQTVIRNKKDIESGKIFLLVKSRYSLSSGLGSNRGRRVKSELITACGVKEGNFITTVTKASQQSINDVVAVSLDFKVSEDNMPIGNDPQKGLEQPPGRPKEAVVVHQ